MAIEEFGGDPIQAHINATRAMLHKRIYDPRLIQHHLLAIETGRMREHEVYAAMDRPALPDQIRALQALATELGMHVSMPPSMSYGQAVIEGCRLAALDRRKRALDAQRRYRQAVAPIRGGAA